jgi:hypothetical protein
MSEAKHTPGPWDSHGEDEVMAGDWDKHVATAWNNDKIEPAEATANARLIAAAPDLLRCLKVLLEAWEAVPPTVQVPEEINVDEIWDNVRFAIAKAEGKD